jgi:hypothetical protein
VFICLSLYISVLLTLSLVLEYKDFNSFKNVDTVLRLPKTPLSTAVVLVHKYINKRYSIYKSIIWKLFRLIFQNLLKL